MLGRGRPSAAGFRATRPGARPLGRNACFDANGVTVRPMSKSRRQFGLKEALIAFSAALILAFGGILAQSAYRAHRQIVSGAASAAESIARSAETSTGRTILSIDAML